jgi:hypothetical protein
MGNGLKMDKKEILAGLFRLGWSSRAINKETGIHRVTIKRYRSEFQNVPKVPADFSSPPFPTREEKASLTEVVEEPILPYTNSITLRPHRPFIVSQRRTAYLHGLFRKRYYMETKGPSNERPGTA